MLGLTKKTDYALLALAYLAKHPLWGMAETPQAVRTRDIAAHHGLPLPILMNVLKELAKARLVKSVRGAGGGYVLARAPDRISVLDVVTAMEGPMRLARCVDNLPVVGQGCPFACKCGIQSAIHQLHDRLADFLTHMTLAEILETDPHNRAREFMVIDVA